MAFINAQGRTQTSLSDINVTPLVDVVLVLLVIFMVTAPVLSRASRSPFRIRRPSRKSRKSVWS